MLPEFDPPRATPRWWDLYEHYREQLYVDPMFSSPKGYAHKDNIAAVKYEVWRRQIDAALKELFG